MIRKALSVFVSRKATLKPDWPEPIFEQCLIESVDIVNPMRYEIADDDIFLMETGESESSALQQIRELPAIQMKRNT